MELNKKRIMPDIAQSKKAAFASPLEWAGMEKVTLPLQLEGGIRVSAEADLFVNVRQREAKGIHMSRLYLAVHESLENKVLSMKLVEDVLKRFVESQQGLADSARLVLRWEELHERRALLSDNAGWKTYPVELVAERVKGETSIDLKFSFFYSSTCPCSAALSRQLYQQAFAKEFHDGNMTFEKVHQWLGESQVASPHSQRSRADVTLRLAEESPSVEILPYINALEEGLKTPVQTAVKREDEQEFARLNGENTMFVEDALRTMKQTLQEFAGIKSFHVKTHHYESLHAHDAVGSISSED